MAAAKKTKKPAPKPKAKKRNLKVKGIDNPGGTTGFNI